MAMAMDDVPRPTLLSRVLDALTGKDAAATNEVSSEVAAATRQSQCDRQRAEQAVEAWDRIEADVRQGHHLFWEDMLGPPANGCREADR